MHIMWYFIGFFSSKLYYDNENLCNKITDVLHSLIYIWNFENFSYFSCSA